MDSKATAAIIGGGFSGTMVAVHLLRALSSRKASGTSVIHIDRAPRASRGVAYSTDHPAHLLNVPAARMSADPDDPDHFLRWAREHVDTQTRPDTFVPRCAYGDYLESLLTAAGHQAATTGVRLHRVNSDAVDVEPYPGGLRVTLSDGTSHAAQAVVLALGNSPPALPRELREAVDRLGPRLIDNPWRPGALDAVPTNRPVLLVGTGLTMMDVALSLRERAPTAMIHAISRRGLLSRAHVQRPLELPPFSGSDWLAHAGSARSLLKAVRAACDAPGAPDWRAVIDSLRPVTQTIWGRWPPRERERFLHHLRPWWDVHRHRAALGVAQAIDSLMTIGVLQTHTGRILAVAPTPEGAAVGVAARNGERHTLDVAAIINCTGPQSDVTRLPDPLVRSLLDRGLIRPDPLRLGIETDSVGRPLSRGRTITPHLFTLGAWRKADLWESIAVPELRVQARDVARAIIGG